MALQDFRGQGPPSDIGTFQVPTGVMVFQHTFSGVTYICAVRSGERGWVLVDHRAVSAANNRIVLNTALALGYEVFLAHGTYLLDASLVLASNDRFEGESWSTILSGAGNFDIISATGADATHLTNIFVGNLYIKGNGTGVERGIHFYYVDYSRIDRVRVDDVGAAPPSGNDGIMLQVCLYCTVSHCYTYNCSNAGIDLVGDSATKYSGWNVVEGNTCRANRCHGVQMWGECRHNTIIGNTSKGNAEQGIQIEGGTGNSGEAQFNTVTGNTCEGNLNRGIDLLEGGSFNTISSNSLQNNTLQGIRLSSGIYTEEGNVIIGNIIKDNGGATGSGIMIETSNVTWTIITGNYLENNGNYGVDLYDGVHHVVEGNQIYNHGRCGIKSTDATYMSIQGNMIQTASEAGIWLGRYTTPSSYSIIAGNKINACATGIMSGGSFDSIEDNNINACTAQGIYITGGNSNYVGGNHIRACTAYGIKVETSDDNVIVNNWTVGNGSGCVRIQNAACDRTRLWGNNFDEGAISDAGTNTIAFDNFDSSAGAWIATIAPPAGGR